MANDETDIGIFERRVICPNCRRLAYCYSHEILEGGALNAYSWIVCEHCNYTDGQKPEWAETEIDDDPLPCGLMEGEGEQLFCCEDGHDDWMTPADLLEIAKRQRF